ncbi:UNVERIFIED_ORG: DUF4245 domain-containing protein [Bacillus sp. AZ43]
MTGAGPTGEQGPSPTGGGAPPASPVIERANRLSAANMLRSLLPLVVICLLIVGWQAFRSGPDVGVRTVDPSTSVQLAAARAGYQVLAPAGLDEEYRPTSARTDAGAAGDGDPVTLEIGYLTPSEEFAGFVVSDDRGADPVAAVLDGARPEGTVELGGESWQRSTTTRGETALSREADGVTVLVSGSASDEELETVARAVKPYSP